MTRRLWGSSTRSEAPPCQGQLYTVEKGDTMYNLALKFSLSVNDLLEANPQVRTPYSIYAGQQICIPKVRPRPKADPVEKETREERHRPQERLWRELPYWMQIFMEHAIFLLAALPCDQEELRREAIAFRERYERLLVGASRVPAEVAGQAISTTREFLAYKQRLLALVIQCRVSAAYALLIDHIAREALEFLRIASGEAEGKSLEALLREEVFWLRIMGDHARFINHLLDPSERQLIEAAESFALIFDDLYRQAEDLQSMLQARPECFSTVSRFTGQVVQKTRDLADFKRQAHDLLEKCQALAVAQPLLLDHVFREAEHFLEILAYLGYRSES